MKKTFAYFIILSLILLNPHNALEAANTADSVNFALLHPNVDDAKVAKIENLIIKRDQGIFKLYKGKLYFAKAIQGQVVMALFVGDGHFRMAPSTAIEKEHLFRVYGTETIEKKFTTLFLAFTDSTFQEIANTVHFEYEEAEQRIKDYFTACACYLGDRNTAFVDQHWPLMAETLNKNSSKGFFYSLITTRDPGALLNNTLSNMRDDPFFFVINPYEEESVRLLRPVRFINSGFYQETVTQFHNQRYLTQSASERTGVTLRYNVDRYQLNVKIEDDLTIKVKAVMAINPHIKLEWLNFDLYYKLDVDSILVNGNKAEYLRPVIKDYGFEQWVSAPLWIKTDESLRNFERGEITVYYHGSVIGRDYDQVYLKASDDWYPVHDITRKQRHTFDITFNHPKEYKIASLGNRVETKDGKKNVMSRWTTERPVRHSTFNIGIFKEFTFKDDKIPELHIVHRYDRDAKTLKNQLMADIANSYAYYSKIFGDRPLKTLFAAEHPFSHSEAYPGLINMWWRAFQSDWQGGDDELIRAHEVAHQWWGINLDFETYHDQWLSEAFSEYSAMMYMQQSFQNNDEFFRVLKESKERLVSNRKSMMDKLLGDDQEAGPIWLGYRTSSSSTQGDYGLIIYEKGMWVLHMIRNMMIDLNKMDEDRFMLLLKDFYETYAGKYASTHDFKTICDKHFNADMTWFFDQWVYGTDIPKYEFAYKVFVQGNGKYNIRCQVKQLNVSKDFKMLIPLTIDFGDKRFARLRVMIQGSGGEFDLPLMPLEPQKIIFNDFESVLCEVEYTNWKN